MNIQKHRESYFTIKSIPIIGFCLFLYFSFQVQTANSQITPHEAISKMTKGINLGNTHEPPTEAGWNNPRAQEYYFDLYKEAGFTFVRVPVRWDGYTIKTSPYTVNKAWLDRIEQVLDWGLSRGLFIIVNSHHDDWLMDNYSSQINRDRFDSIWSQIATRFKDKPDRLIFEIMNEPNGPITRAQNDEMHQRVLSLIRKTNPTRLVVFQGNNWGGSNELLAAAIPKDDYLIGSFHSYDPYLFGLEGKGVWGTVTDHNILRAKFASVKEWSEKNNIPVLLGEFGSLRACDYNSRMKHYRAYVDFSRQYGFAPAAWDDGGNFRIMLRNERKWEEVKDILVHTTENSPFAPVIQILQDSIIRVSWGNKKSGADSIIIQKRTSNSEYRNMVSFNQDTTFIYDVKPAMDQYHNYRIISFFPDGEVAYSNPQRIFFPKWVKPVRAPFHGFPLAIPGVIEAEDFDKGGQGLTYFDTGSTNIAGAYRPNEPVDIYDRGGNGFHIGNALPGEWYEYSVDVKTRGTYEVGFYLASLLGGGKFQVSIGNVFSDTLRAPRTNSWLTTQKVSTTMRLDAGEQIMRFSVIADPLYNIDYYSFDLATSITPAMEQTGEGLLVYYDGGRQEINVIRNDFHPCRINIYHSNGSLIRNIHTADKHTRISSSGFRPGLYIVQMVSDHQKSVSKIIIR
jgi:aryl-phospho-beta-D-glucosidase BglC (GH1 family)